MNPNRLVIAFAIFFLAIGLLNGLTGLTVDWLWFRDVGYASVFSKTVVTRVLCGLAGFLVAFVFLAGNLLLAHRRSPLRNFAVFANVNLVRSVSDRRIPLLLLAASGALALLFGLAASAGWFTVLTALHRVSYGVTDPLFGRDVSFYLFTFPLLELFRGWGLALLAVTTIACAIIYFLKGGILIEGRLMLRPARHLAVLVALFGVGLAFSYWLSAFGLLHSPRGVAHGASYTDVHAQLPAYRILLGACLAASVLIIYGTNRRRLPILASGPVLILAALIIAGWLYPAALQKLGVEPNELEKERPYIANNIRFTRLAYDLADVQENDYPAAERLSIDDLRRDRTTLDNIRLWDWRPLRSTYAQIQEIRLYYNFLDVDVDRYTLDGDYRQVMLSPRELSSNQIPAEARTWVNLHLKYTHGYGLCMSPVNQVTAEGLPQLFIRDIPPVSTTDLKVDRPAIYYGEDTRTYALVKTSTQEFDYPIGNSNAFTTYEGTGGVGIGGFFRRALFAYYFRDLKLLLTGYLTRESRVLFFRRIQDRVRRIAPFLRYDHDPYMVVHDGKLYWILDAYTVSGGFPYSEPIGGGINYIRNSVKVVIDAFNGTTTYYAVDTHDPVLATYRKIFPDLFTGMDQLPEGLRAHLRYPEDLFQIQAQVFAKYHMTDPETFYNREDLWAIPTELYAGREARVEPYYVLMRLPGEKTDEEILIIPFTPSNKDNMIAWLAARCDPAHYGERLAYNFPKQKLIYGPRQIEARIDQDPVISEALTLWSQRGSQVIRGNLLVIPIEPGLLYVEPLYLQAEQGELPELKRVIVAVGNEIGMEPDLDGALASVFGQPLWAGKGATAGGAGATGSPTESATENEPGALGELSGETGGGPAPGGTASPNQRQLSAEALAVYQQAQDALRNGDWAAYGTAQQRLGVLLRSLAAASGTDAPD